MNRKTLNPGESTFVQFRLEKPVTVDTGDRYIVRTCSEAYTIGGGTIVESHPKKLKYLPDKELKKFENLERADPEHIILHHLANNPDELKTVEQLARELAVQRENIRNIVKKMIGKNIVAAVTDKPSKGIVLTEYLENARRKVVDFLTQFHRQFPFRLGIKKSELKNKLFGPINTSVYEAILSPLSLDDEIKTKGEIVCLATHSITFAPQEEAIKNKIEALYLNSNYATPSPRGVVEQFSDVNETVILNIITGMKELGILVEIKTAVEKPVLFHIENVRAAEKILVDVLKKNGEVRVSEFRETIKSSRKYATPLLIYFDQKGVTERVGEIRRLKAT